MKVGIMFFIIVVALVGMLMFSPPARAELVTIVIEGVVDDVVDPDYFLNGQINIGDVITGSYTYDTDIPNSSPFSGIGRYEHYAYPCGISLDVDGLNFKTDFSPGLPDCFTMWITNGSSGVDGISVISDNNLPLPDGTRVNNIVWYLQDTSENAISSIELPTTAPVLGAWQENFLSIGGGIRSREGFVFLSHVTSAVVIPEPTTILVLGLGGFIFVRRAKK